MAQYYQVLNGGNATFTLEDLQQLYPNIQSLQCIDSGNGSIQYIINQEEPIQYQNQHVIGIDQTGAPIHLEAYPQQQVLLDGSLPQQGVYVIEAVDPAVQAATVDIQDQRHVLTAQPQFVVQQVQQLQPLQTLQHSQQTHHLQSSQTQNTQQTVLYETNPGSNGLTVVNASAHASAIPAQVTSNETVHEHIPTESSTPQACSLEEQITEKSQVHVLNQNSVTLQNNTILLPDGRKISLAEWQQLQQQQQQLQLQLQEQQQQQNQQNNEHTQDSTKSSSPQPQQLSIQNQKRSERAGVITITRQHLEPCGVGGSPSRQPHLLQQRLQQQQLQQPQQPLLQKQRRQQPLTPSQSPQILKHQQPSPIQVQQRSVQAVIGQQRQQEQQQQRQQQQQQEQHLQAGEATALQEQVSLQRHSQPYAGPRRTYANKSRARTHNTLVTNNTVQAIASPTGEHQNLLQQHDNVISVGDQTSQTPQTVNLKDIHQQIPPNALTQIVLLLPNGEQRNLKFDIPPQGNYSIQDLLEQVGITLDHNMTVVNLPGVNTSDQQTKSVEVKELGTEQQIQSNQVATADKQVVLQSSPQKPGISPTLFKQVDAIQQKTASQEVPKYVEGRLAICHHCGYTSIDFNSCQRCRRKLPEPVKSIPAFITAKKKLQEPVAKDKGNIKANLKDLETNKPGKRKNIVRKSRKLVEEPVILTLSSDEEDQRQNILDSSPEKSLSNSLSSNGSTQLLSGDYSVTSSAMGKEPIIPEDEAASDSADDKSNVKGRSRDEDITAVIEGSMEGSYTLLHCRTVRIGSYKVVPKEGVILSSVGLRILVPSIEDESKAVTLSVDINEIVKVLIHFGRGMPVLFFYAVPTAASRIRRALKMVSKNGPYYDPTSQDDTQKRITLLPEKLHDESKMVLKTIFGNLNVLGELNNKEANDILVRASPKEVQNMMKKVVGMSPQKAINNEIQTIMVYPPPPAKGGIAINTEDYACLGEDQFLNDVIIDFYLKYLTLSVLSEQDQQRTHVFSSFFYKRLTTRPVRSTRKSHPVEDDLRLSPAEKRHSRVKSWTKNVNLFDKDFIVIPINEHSHWFLAIICFPGLTGPVKMSDNTPVDEAIMSSRKRSSKKKITQTEILTKTMQIGSTTITPVKCTDTITLEAGEDGSDRDEAEGDDEDMIHGASDDEDGNCSQSEADNAQKSEIPNNETAEEAKPKCIKSEEPIKQPCILIFDSLGGSSRTRVVATLRDYLRIEYKTKAGKERDFSKDIVKGASPKVPQQNNYTDCGLYLLQYVESFFRDPIKDYYLPMKNLINWFPEDVVSHKREDLQKLLLSLMTENGIIVSSLNLPKLTFSSRSQQESPNKNVSSKKEEGETPSQETNAAANAISAEAGKEPCPSNEDGSAATKDEDTANKISTERCEVPKDVSSRNECSGNVEHSSQETCVSETTVTPLVDYSDDSDEKESMEVDGESTGTTEKANALSYLKAKRIDRHTNRETDRTPPKKVRTVSPEPQDNR